MLLLASRWMEFITKMLRKNIMARALLEPFVGGNKATQLLHDCIHVYLVLHLCSYWWALCQNNHRARKKCWHFFTHIRLVLHMWWGLELHTEAKNRFKAYIPPINSQTEYTSCSYRPNLLAPQGQWRWTIFHRWSCRRAWTEIRQWSPSRPP